MTFQHYIITRFNISLNAQGYCPVCTDEYLDYRFPLFERYCFPSVKAQSCQNFKWLVLFDAHTPERYLRRAETLHQSYPNFIPCYMNIPEYELVGKDEDYDDIENNPRVQVAITAFLRRYIEQQCGERPDFYVTTRLDSDDALHRDMVASIQHRVHTDSRKVAYDFVYSYKYILSEGIVYRYLLKNGHFLTLVEPSTEELRSVLFCNHLHIDDFVKVEHIHQRPLQTELIHGGNVVNDFTELTIGGLLYALLHFHKQDFGYQKIHHSYKRTFWIMGSLVKQRFIH